MALSADEVQIAIIEEVAYGQTPASPVFQVLPLTGEGIVAEVSSQTSNLMTDDRQVLDLITTSISASGDISTELAITPAMKILLASAMAEDWVAVGAPIAGVPPLEESMIGKDQLSYTIEKRFPNPASEGEFLYHRITGCITNTANMGVSPEEPATMSFGVIGKEMLTDTTILVGATYITPENPTVLRGPDTLTLGIRTKTVDVDCFGAFGWDLNNNYRGLLCLGHLGNKSMVLGRSEITVNMQLYFSSNELLDTLLAQEETNIEFEMQTPATEDPGSYFASYFPRVKLSQNNIVAGGTGEDVIEDITAQSLYNSAGLNDTLGTNDADKTSMRVVTGIGALGS